jgi:hypothetical protein
VEHIRPDHAFGEVRVLAHTIPKPPLIFEPNGLSFPGLHLGYDGALGFCETGHGKSS